MPNEPERDIEKVLKSYAKKRQEDAGASLEMHPATRRLLQSEVARKFQKAGERSGGLNLFSRFWPRFALGGSIFIVLMIGLWMVISQHPEPKAKMDLALDRESRLGVVKDETRLSARKSPAAEPFVPQAPSTPATDSFYLADENKTIFTVTNSSSKPVLSSSSTDLAKNLVRAEEADRPTPQLSARRAIGQAGAAGSVDELKKKENAPQTSRSRDYALAATPPPVVAPTTPLQAGDAETLNAPAAASAINGGVATYSSGGALSSNLSMNGLLTWDLRRDQVEKVPSNSAFLLTEAPASSTQVFSRLTMQNRGDTRTKAQDASPVLARFAVEQTGDQLRILDGDGSVYYGFYNADEASKSIQLQFNTEQFKQKTEVFADKNLAGEIPSKDTIHKNKPFQKRFFRVSGTNLTLHQPILFTGNMTLSTNQFPQTFDFDRIQSTNSASSAGVGGGTIQEREPQLEGKVVIGGTNQILINAAPVAPGK
ncbi:hypothetical protein [Pedosphaera parvula]|uniref:Uncharacterized protein n=1 Tax=Pedosphaera parvula (strain Ellin514) TaxID=320771 RepID=B9XQ35_PEDPL|nr:hypothetical protein [Pedosphaera parvula]EEF58039.1 hypothetical protein Cflav_PD1176 [Pedosphaera parvula Ellin514]